MLLRSRLRSESQQEKIAKSTLRLVAECGADRVNVADVIKAMGITRATMNRHCPTEDDLWRVTAAFIERRMEESWNGVVTNDLSPADQLRSLLAVQIGLIKDMPALREFMFSRALHGSNAALHQGLRNVRAHLEALLTDNIREGMSLGQYPKSLDPEKTAHRIIETLQGMVVSWSLDAETDDVIEEAWTRLDGFVPHTTGRPALAPATCRLTRAHTGGS